MGPGRVRWVVEGLGRHCGRIKVGSSRAGWVEERVGQAFGVALKYSKTTLEDMWPESIICEELALCKVRESST